MMTEAPPGPPSRIRWADQPDTPRDADAGVEKGTSHATHVEGLIHERRTGVRFPASPLPERARCRGGIELVQFSGVFRGVEPVRKLNTPSTGQRVARAAAPALGTVAAEGVRVSTDLRLEATSQQLLAEIAASPYRSVRQLASAMGVDYATLSRHINGRAPLKMERVFDILEYLDLPLADFFVRVQLRVEGLQLPVLQRTA